MSRKNLLGVEARLARIGDPCHWCGRPSTQRDNLYDRAGNLVHSIPVCELGAIFPRQDRLRRQHASDATKE